MHLLYALNIRIILAYSLCINSHHHTIAKVLTDSLNGCQIAAKLVPLKTHTYTGDMACLKKVEKRPTTSPANKYHLLPFSSPERVLQLASSGDMVNNSGKKKALPLLFSRASPNKTCQTDATEGPDLRISCGLEKTHY
ncbi:hypothetical protein DSO57_1014912 [Entomophthora muscae]|uniref:Uncharacterized protein n=1 Tax=Entomophthora muscae TaxID=34485 RepID=A0ACC2T576_9FUNG|nr:hypothetical protein DSO57_1014912 [Entomophthora muscae]